MEMRVLHQLILNHAPSVGAILKTHNLKRKRGGTFRKAEETSVARAPIFCMLKVVAASRAYKRRKLEPRIFHLCKTAGKTFP